MRRRLVAASDNITLQYRSKTHNSLDNQIDFIFSKLLVLLQLHERYLPTNWEILDVDSLVEKGITRGKRSCKQ